VGGSTADEGHPAARSEGVGAGSGEGVAFHLQRHVAALLAGHGRAGGPSLACGGSLPHHHAFEPSGRRGAAEGERAAPGEGAGAAERTQEDALALVAPGQPECAGGPDKSSTVLLASKLQTARAWELKETFSHVWSYKSVTWAAAFLDYWCYRAMRSRLEPMKKVARMLRTHEKLLLKLVSGERRVFPVARLRVLTTRSEW